MPSPVLPAQIKAAVADPSSSLCANFKDTLLKLPVLLSQWFSWAFNLNGTVSDAFKAEFQEPGTYLFLACISSRSDVLLCDGSAKTIATYPALAAAIGSTYGTSLDSTQFVLPDFRDKFPRGVATGSTTAIGQSGGSETIVMTQAQLVAHTHPMLFERAKNDTGSVDAAGTYCLNIQTGVTAQLNTGLAPDHADSATPDPINVVNPFLGCYIYIKT